MLYSPDFISSRIVRISALALAAQIALSWPLWNSSAGRTFPLLPLGGLSFPENTGWSGVQAWLTIGWLAAAILFPKKKSWPAALLCWFGWLIVQDLNRLQPWMYFYLLVWGMVIARADFQTVGLRWLIAAVYAWGGFNKLTPYFAEDNFPWFCEAFFWTKPLGKFPAAGYAVALAELLFAFGLLWQKTRAAFRLIVVGFHLFIAVALSPAGLDWNAVVIPWNFAMAAMVWVLFGTGSGTNIAYFLSWRQGGINLRTDRFIKVKLEIGNLKFEKWDGGYSHVFRANTTTNDPTPGSFLFNFQISNFKFDFKKSGFFLKLIPPAKPATMALLVLAWLFPILNIFHAWDEALSWKMYSNTQMEATFYSTGGAPCPEMSRYWQRHAYDRGTKLLLDDWSMDEMRVPAYNSRRTFRQIARYLCPCAHNEAGLLLLSVERWNKSVQSEEKIPCDQLLDN